MLIAGMSFGILTGCGKDAEPTTTPEKEVTTEVESEAAEETATEEVTNPEDSDLTMVAEEETTTEEEATEEVAEADFFAENGLTVVAPADVANFNGRMQGTDDVVTLGCTVEMTETSPTTSEFVWTVNGTENDVVNGGVKFQFDWGLEAYDRATGTYLWSPEFKTGDTANGEAFTVPLSDTETIDVAYEFGMTQGEDYIMQVTMTCTYPEGYADTVFAIYGAGLKEKASADATNIADKIASGAIPADATFIAIQ